MANNPPPTGSQFHPMIPPQGQPFVAAASQQFHPIGQFSSPNSGMPTGQSQPPPYSQSLQQFPPRPGQASHPISSSQGMPMPYMQTNRPLTSGSPQIHNIVSQFNGQIPSVSAPGMFMSSSYTFVPQNNANASPQFQAISQMHTPIAGQDWSSSGGSQSAMQTVVTSAEMSVNAESTTQQSSSDWQEHTASDGRRYYYNKKTKQSSWDKPVELMTPIERADATTVWKEFSTADGKKYYYNKVTKQSVWSIPEDLKLAREQAQKAIEGPKPEPHAPAANAVTSGATMALTPASPGNASSLPVRGSSPIAFTPPAASTSISSVENAGSGVTAAQTAVMIGVGGLSSTATSSASVSAVVASTGFPAANVIDNLASTGSFGSVSSLDAGTSRLDIEVPNKGRDPPEKTHDIPVQQKTMDGEPLVYSSKQEAKNAFKALLEFANVQSDWTWEQAMKEIVSDKRYGALKTLGERKQAFNEYLGQRRKLEAEERRTRQKKAREEFTKMLEECKELTSSTKWSKAVSMFEGDERFKAVERARDREDLFDNFVVELGRKEKEKAAEERRQNIALYRKYLESCDFIKVNSQWRKIQDRLEDDERCSRLDKIDRLLVFQDYIRDLEKEEEEQKKIQKDQTRRDERKNRDEFRKLLEEHAAVGTLTAKSYWRDYCSKVKDLPQYQAVASNTSGSTPKDLFEDAVEDLEKQYHDDKSRVKDTMKSSKISLSTTWSFEDFKAAVLEDIGSPPISEINLELVYEDLLERAKEKEEKEAKKRQRLVDDFRKLLQTFKEINASSSWEECKTLFEECEEYRSIEEESQRKDIFEEYIAHLMEKAKEKERKREEEKARKEKEREEKEKRKEKERKEKDKEREKEKGKERSKKDDTDSENDVIEDEYDHKEEKKRDRDRDRDKDRRHHKRHHISAEDGTSDQEEKEESKRSRRHGSDRKKSRKHAYSPDSDTESRHKRHKRDHRDGSRRSGGYEELEDGELGEDGEIE